MAVLAAFLVAQGAWLLVMEHSIRRLTERVTVLQALSVGLTREEVVKRLGRPAYSIEGDARFNRGKGEVLVYKSYRHTKDDIFVVLGEDGRVLSVVYPVGSGTPPEGGVQP